MESNSDMQMNSNFVRFEQMEKQINFQEEHKQEIIRIVSQFLQENGLQKSAKILEEESGVHIEGAIIQQFRKHVLDGKFEEVIKIISEIEYDQANIEKVKTYIYEQKYFELLEKKEVTLALDCLRNELIPSLKTIADPELDAKSKMYSTLLMCKSPQEIYPLAKWDGSAGESRK